MTSQRSKLAIALLAIVVIAGISAIELSTYQSARSPAPLEAASISDSVNVVAVHPTSATGEVGISPHEQSLYSGVVTYTVYDKDHNVKGVYVSHNTRTVQGINCLEQIMFNGLSPGPLNTNGTNVCGFQAGSVLTSAKFNGFRFIGVINQTTARNDITLNGSDTVATSKIGGTRTTGNHGIVFTSNQGLPVNSTVAGTATYNQITITSSAIPFTGIGASGTNICGAVLLNSTSTTANALFAENKFSCVLLANTDTLTITWTINVS